MSTEVLSSPSSLKEVLPQDNGFLNLLLLLHPLTQGPLLVLSINCEAHHKAGFVRQVESEAFATWATWVLRFGLLTLGRLLH